MNNGSRPTRLSHKDFDLHRSFGNIAPVSFPTEYFVDAGFTMPNQVEEGEPFGCTNYAQAELTTDLTGEIHHPQDLEAVTHANALRGYDVRESLNAACKSLKWFTAYYNIRSSGIIDSFDAFRLAQISGLPEKRSITLGTPWFPSWKAAMYGSIFIQNADGTYTTMGGGVKSIIMPMPTEAELSVARRDPLSLTWHDSKLDGWTTRNGVLLYRDKSWQGPNIGEGGFIYFPREVINVVMSIPRTVAYTITNQTPEKVQTVSLSAVQWITSYIRHLLGL